MLTFDTLIQTARSAVNDKITLINGITRELEELREQPTPDPTRIAELRTRKESASAELPRLERALTALRDEQDDDDRLTRAAEKSYPAADRQSVSVHTQDRSRTYTETNQGEFLSDLWKFSNGGLQREASERLERHEREAQASGQMSTRAISTTGFAGIIPPQFLIEQYALIARAGRPTANVVQKFILPDEGMSFVIPRGTTGVSTAVQAVENTTLTTTDQVWANLTVPVFTIGAYNDVSRQALERSSMVDTIMFGDLAASYAVTLDQQVLSGTGTAGQGLGILATSGTSQASAFTAAATVQTFYSKLVGQINAIQTSRFFSPTVIICHPRRWNWLVSQLDSSNRPLVVPQSNGPTNAYAISTIPIDIGSADAVGSLFGLPVITDASIPTAVGAASEDQVIVCRKEDLFLWEDPAAPFMLRFDQTVASSLTVKLVAYGYGAFTAGRYPAAVGIVGGNSPAGMGLVAPIF